MKRWLAMCLACILCMTSFTAFAGDIPPDAPATDVVELEPTATPEPEPTPEPGPEPEPELDPEPETEPETEPEPTEEPGLDGEIPVGEIPELEDALLPPDYAEHLLDIGFGDTQITLDEGYAFFRLSAEDELFTEISLLEDVAVRMYLFDADDTPAMVNAKPGDLLSYLFEADKPYILALAKAGAEPMGLTLRVQGFAPVSPLMTVAMATMSMESPDYMRVIINPSNAAAGIVTTWGFTHYEPDESAETMQDQRVTGVVSGEYLLHVNDNFDLTVHTNTGYKFTGWQVRRNGIGHVFPAGPPYNALRPMLNFNSVRTFPDIDVQEYQILASFATIPTPRLMVASSPVFRTNALRQRVYDLDLEWNELLYSPSPSDIEMYYEVYVTKGTGPRTLEYIVDASGDPNDPPAGVKIENLEMGVAYTFELRAVHRVDFVNGTGVPEANIVQYVSLPSVLTHQINWLGESMTMAVTGLDASSIQIAWGSVPNAKSYRVERRTGTGAWQPLKDAYYLDSDGDPVEVLNVKGETSYALDVNGNPTGADKDVPLYVIDDTPIEGIVYTYRVTALNEDLGPELDVTDSPSVTGTGRTVPWPALVLAADVMDFETIVLGWNPIPGADRYEVSGWSKPPGSPLTTSEVIGTIAGGSPTEFRHENLAPGTVYHYQIRVFGTVNTLNVNGREEVSRLSNAVNRTPTWPRIVPRIAVTSYNQVKLSWDPIRPDPGQKISYAIYRTYRITPGIGDANPDTNKTPIITTIPAMAGYGSSVPSDQIRHTPLVEIGAPGYSEAIVLPNGRLEYVDDDLIRGITYYYTVLPYVASNPNLGIPGDEDGVQARTSHFSAVLRATPAWPRLTLTATAQTINTILLRWNAIPNMTYVIERSTASSDFTRADRHNADPPLINPGPEPSDDYEANLGLAETPVLDANGNTTHFTASDTGLMPSVGPVPTYHYRITATPGSDYNDFKNTKGAWLALPRATANRKPAWPAMALNVNAGSVVDGRRIPDDTRINVLRWTPLAGVHGYQLVCAQVNNIANIQRGTVTPIFVKDINDPSIGIFDHEFHDPDDPTVRLRNVTYIYWIRPYVNGAPNIADVFSPANPPLPLVYSPDVGPWSAARSRRPTWPAMTLTVNGVCPDTGLTRDDGRTNVIWWNEQQAGAADASGYQLVCATANNSIANLLKNGLPTVFVENIPAGGDSYYIHNKLNNTELLGNLTYHYWIRPYFGSPPDLFDTPNTSPNVGPWSAVRSRRPVWQALTVNISTYGGTGAYLSWTMANNPDRLPPSYIQFAVQRRAPGEPDFFHLTPHSTSPSQANPTTDNFFADTNLDTGRSYSYRVRPRALVPGTGNFASGPIWSTVRMLSPAYPATTLQYIASSPASVTLRWNAQPNVTKYMVERAITANGPWTQFVLVDPLLEHRAPNLIAPGTWHVYTDATPRADRALPKPDPVTKETGFDGVNPGQFYHYRVTPLFGPSFDVQGRRSAAVRTQAVITPPREIKIGIASDFRSCVLEWNAVEGADGYEVFRATSATGPFIIPIETIFLSAREDDRETVRTFTDDNSGRGLDTGARYFYMIRSFYYEGGTVPSGNSVAVAFTPSLELVDTASFEANRTHATIVRLTWDAVDGADGYEIGFATTAAATAYTLVGTVLRGDTEEFQHSGISLNVRAGKYRIRPFRNVAGRRVYPTAQPLYTFWPENQRTVGALPLP